jgi:hypothetical protein
LTELNHVLSRLPERDDLLHVEKDMIVKPVRGDANTANIDLGDSVQPQDCRCDLLVEAARHQNDSGFPRWNNGLVRVHIDEPVGKTLFGLVRVLTVPVQVGPQRALDVF